MEIPSFPQVFQLGHKYIADLLDGPVVVQEKVDGSQFSMAAIDDKLVCRSKNAMIDLDNPGMFKLAVETAQRLRYHLVPEWVYRGEFLQKPKHNALAYARIPNYNIILYDVMTGIEVYLPPQNVKMEANRLALECTPTFIDNEQVTVDSLRKLLELESILGETKVEGIVIKNYSRFGPDKKVMMGKLVRADFQEVNKVNWKKENPQSGDILERLVEAYATEARWGKAVQHLRDAGKLQGVPQDIGLLIREVPDDVRKEAEEEIRDRLWAWAWPHISRGITRGVPGFYKRQLAEGACLEPGTTLDDGKSGSGTQSDGELNGVVQGRGSIGSEG